MIFGGYVACMNDLQGSDPDFDLMIAYLKELTDDLKIVKLIFDGCYSDTLDWYHYDIETDSVIPN